MKNIKILVGFGIGFLALLLFTAFGKIASSESVETTQLIRVSVAEADSAEPGMASAADGSVYLVWVEHRANSNADVFLQKFDAERKPVSEKLRINPQAGGATAWRGDPPTVYVGSDNAVYVGWTARVESDAGNANDLFLSVSHDGGQSFGSPVKVNDDKKPGVHGMHSLAIDKNNHVYMSWLDERSLKKEMPDMPAKSEDKNAHHHMEQNREVYFAVSKDGGKSFGKNKRLAADACPCCKTATLAALDGRVYVSWRQVLPGNFRHIAVAASNDDGASFSPTTIVSDDKWEIDGCPVSGAALAVSADNNLKAVWYSAGTAGKAGLYWAESKDGGKTFSPRMPVYEGIVAGTPILLADKQNDFKIVWQSDGKIMQLKTPLISNVTNQAEEIGTGKLPAAALTGDKLFIGFIQTESDKRSIWLY